MYSFRPAKSSRKASMATGSLMTHSRWVTRPSENAYRGGQERDRFSSRWAVVWPSSW